MNRVRAGDACRRGATPASRSRSGAWPSAASAPDRGTARSKRHVAGEGRRQEQRPHPEAASTWGVTPGRATAPALGIHARTGAGNAGAGSSRLVKLPHRPGSVGARPPASGRSPRQPWSTEDGKAAGRKGCAGVSRTRVKKTEKESG
ncbi:unnamed protein product [Miscanthus lutarioriparius]|uniref:Uncharacterized protein n=1 Tax=Miscanthus lutarioriparius TaxID=422564 RepID=A0A811MUD5_9POAL|nr:unnamed protein product [Miscanthus lutarioriparius]